MCRSRFMPDLIHRKNESHLGMDRYESRRFTGRGPLSFLQQRGPGPALCCLDQNPPQEYPGMKRNRVTLQVRMSISRQKDSQMLNLRSDQRPGRLISGSQSLRRRLSSQNRCSFSRAGSSQEPSAGFCAKRRKKSTVRFSGSSTTECVKTSVQAELTHQKKQNQEIKITKNL